MTRALNLGLHLAVYGGALALLWPEADGLAWAFGFAAILIWVSTIDLERFEIPDLAAGALVLTGAFRTLFVPGLPLTDHLMGSVLWPVLTWSVAALYARVRGWRGLGFGDVKLTVGLGLWLGFQAMIWVLLSASVAGILTLLSIGAMRHTSFRNLGTSAVAFGPFLCLSAWVIWLKGQG